MSLTTRDQTIRDKGKTIGTNQQTSAKQYPVKETRIKADKYKIPLVMVIFHPACKRLSTRQTSSRSKAIMDTVQAQTMTNST